MIEVGDLDWYLACAILTLFCYTLPLFQFSVNMNMTFTTMYNSLYDIINWMVIYVFALFQFSLVANIWFG